LLSAQLADAKAVGAEQTQTQWAIQTQTR